MAVLYVVVDHGCKLFGHPLLLGADIEWFGRLGVMFFFVHTCTVLMMSLERQQGKFSTAGSIANFYIRRIFRIYPLSVFAITFVLLFGIPSERIQAPFSFARCIPSKTELFTNLLLVQNLLPNTRQIIGVLWSLPFEVQMYAFLPFLYLYCARKDRLRLLFVFWVAGWIVGYMGPLKFVPQFIPGVMAYVLMQRVRTNRIPGWAWPIFLAGLTVAFLAVNPSFLSGRFVCLALGLAMPYFQDIRLRHLNMVTHNIAKYSYGVYLFHPFCLWFAFVHLSSQAMAFRFVVFAALIFAVPVVLFHALEDPLIGVGARLGNRLFSRRGKKDLPPCILFQEKTALIPASHPIPQVTKPAGELPGTMDEPSPPAIRDDRA